METQTNTTIDPEEIERFSRMAGEWWDPEGKFKPLHRINPLRIKWIVEKVAGEGWSVEEGPLFNPPRSTRHAPLHGKAVLDIGCGGGLISEPMARLGAQVTGVDAGHKNIEVARLHAKGQGLAIDYRASSAEALAEAGEQYDVVLALEIIEHVADIPAFVAAASALVKPGGVIVWSTINRTSKAYALAIVGAEYVLRWLPRGTHQWNKFVKPSELHAQLRVQGMTVTDMTGLTMHPLTFVWKLDPRDVSVNYMLAACKPAI